MPEQAAAAMARGATRRRPIDRWFYIGAALFMILLSIAGFGPSIVDPSRRNLPPTSLVMAHGAAAGAWLLLFLTQATLVATRRIAVHRRLGVVGPFLAVVMIALGYLTIVDGARRGYDLSGDLTRALVPPGSPPPVPAEAAAGILPPLLGFLNFGVLVAAALWYRHRPEIHKRLMLIALAPLAGEPVLHLIGHLVGRWPDLYGVLSASSLISVILFLSVSAIHDKVSQGRIHPVSVWVPILLLASMISIGAVLPSAAWQDVAAWLIR